MRTQREFFKPQKEGVHLHIYNHTVTMEDYSLPLSDLEKQKFKSLTPFGLFPIQETSIHYMCLNRPARPSTKHASLNDPYGFFQL